MLRFIAWCLLLIFGASLFISLPFAVFYARAGWGSQPGKNSFGYLDFSLWVRGSASTRCSPRGSGRLGQPAGAKHFCHLVSCQFVARVARDIALLWVSFLVHMLIH